MRLKFASFAFGLAVVFAASAAEARPTREMDHDHWNPFVQHSSAASDVAQGKRQRYSSTRTRAERVRYASTESSSSYGGGSVGARPRAWCGWWMRTQRGGGPELNLAWNWSRWGHAASGPQVGAVVVWPHHVGEIVGQAANGQWLVRSGNDGGAVRTRARSVAGAVFRVG